MDDLAILFCRPERGSVLEDDFELEADVVDALELESFVISADLVIDGECERAVRRIPRDVGALLYRGPILTAEEYEALYEAAADHVKSAKEAWDDACFVPSDATRQDFFRIARGLLDERGERFERGFVIRKFLDLAPSGVRTMERRIPDEHRLFFWNGRIVCHAPYHDIGDRLEDVSPFSVLGRRIDSPSFTADIAFFLREGGWVVIEINDGGVSTLPPQLDPRDLYSAIGGR